MPFHPMGRLHGLQQYLKLGHSSSLCEWICPLMSIYLETTYTSIDCLPSRLCHIETWWPQTSLDDASGMTGVEPFIGARHRLCRCISSQCSWHFGDSIHPWPQEHRSKMLLRGRICSFFCIVLWLHSGHIFDADNMLIFSPAELWNAVNFWGEGTKQREQFCAPSMEQFFPRVASPRCS